ncbi:glycoside hydrolase [Tothia fuscella]|uniref:glucan 1,3-beta-glucosidase n=1 Tax=Tothia fuscella TaxID=1048955 RepID=A0A9P4NM28_9PEZI|nr:glycoside hydrolase [Tothia fuscella]
MLSAGSSTEKLNATAASSELPPPQKKNRKLLWIILGIIALVLASVGIIIGALVAKDVIHVNRKSTTQSAAAAQSETTSSSSGSPTISTASNTTSSVKPTETSKCTTEKNIPSKAKGTWMDPTSWLDMKDFNCTFTDATVGGLPMVGLNSTWDDSKQANSQVPALDKSWGSYASKPMRGVNIGGWLSLEPFITPSLFDGDSTLVDEYTLCSKLGPEKAAETLEKHYSTFITEDDFKAIAAAGLDHVRIPFSYWAIKTYDNDPYVLGVSWRYLLRGIEWARKYGIRVKLDLHAAPGSQNGWNHSGRSGKVNWISGPDGAKNAKRTLDDIHAALSKFFAQERYKNVIAIYGLVNEPAPTIPIDALTEWTEQAYDLVSKNGIKAIQAFSESMRGLPIWAGKLQGHGTSLAIDVHEYTLFDPNTISLNHAKRIEFACSTWTNQITGTGFGNTMVGEWSQADTDCTKYLNGVNTGARWIGTFNGGSTPMCPTQDNQCSCDQANADPSTFSSEYKLFLKTWAEAQMFAFEKSWGWFYWTWKTESAPLWSYQAALAGGFMPKLAYQKDWDCSKPIPSLGGLPEFY